MKGYIVLTVLAATLFLLLPVIGLRQAPAAPTAATSVEDANSTILTVRHSNGDECSPMTARDLTLYAVIGEMPIDAPEEAMKAQVVACYTSFLYEQHLNGEVTSVALPYPDAFCESYWQAQWGEAYQTNMERYRQAVDDVIGTVLMYDGEPILAAYHALNTGQTEAASTVLGTDVPYLQSVSSPADALAEDQFTTVTVPVAEAKKTLALLCETDEVGEAASWFGETTKSAAGTVLSLTVCGTQQSGTAVKEAFSLPSAAFEVCVQGEDVIFTVAGRGHFLGMSVYGAQTMAEQGNTYQEILKHYYPNAVIVAG